MVTPSRSLSPSAFRSSGGAAALTILAALSGCSRGPAAVRPVAVDSGDASRCAIEQYDKNGDGALDDAELAAVPGIKKHTDKYDKDGDGKISRDEIAGRIDLWAEQGMGIRSVDVVVRLDRQPLSGANVRLVPEPYLGDGPKEADGVTDASGFARLSVAKEDLPEALQKAHFRGVFGGTYKIEITHPKRKLPEKLNVHTELGEEVARDTIGDRVELELTSR